MNSHQQNSSDFARHAIWILVLLLPTVISTLFLGASLYLQRWAVTPAFFLVALGLHIVLADSIRKLRIAYKNTNTETIDDWIPEWEKEINKIKQDEPFNRIIKALNEEQKLLKEIYNNKNP